jgi:hypothetical protein
LPEWLQVRVMKPQVQPFRVMLGYVDSG